MYAFIYLFIFCKRIVMYVHILQVSVYLLNVEKHTHIKKFSGQIYSYYFQISEHDTQRVIVVAKF
jgi:hypothetical protein